MRQSLPGLAKTVARGLKSSRDDHACIAAFSVCEMVDNLRKVKDGEATLEDFFAVYVFDGKPDKPLANTIRRNDFFCMRDEEPLETEDGEALF